MPTRVIAVANQKGGVGKTTTAVNLSACVADRGYRVLVVDVDPQANATSGLGVEQEEGCSVYSVLLREATMESHIRDTGITNLSLVPSELDLAGAEIDVARMDDYLQGLKKALAPLIASDNFDYIIIDCPPSLGILTMNALTAAHSLLLPIQCEYYALEGLSVVARIIDQLRETGVNPGLGVEGIVMTMFDARTNLSADVVAEVRRHFTDQVFRTVIPRNIRLSEAPSFGQPVIAYDPHCVGAKAYRDLAEEFIQRTTSP